jgi:hypothetical protein
VGRLPVLGARNVKETNERIISIRIKQNYD